MATRAPQVSYRVGKQILTTQSAPVVRRQTVGASTANNAFFHALFGRIALRDGSTVEITSHFDKQTGRLELDIPDNALEALNAIEKGDRLREYLSWLTDGAVGTGGAGHMKTLTTIGPFGAVAGPANTQQLLASIILPTDELDGNTAILFRAWGTFGENDKEKTARVTLNGALLGENDLTISPNGLDWSFSGTVAVGSDVSHEVITDGLVGNATQNSKAVTITGTVGEDWVIEVYGYSDESPLEVDDVVCRAIMVRY